MRKRAILALLLAVGAPSPAGAQALFMQQTNQNPEADYIRSLADAAVGFSEAEINLAGAESVRTDTWIRLNEYVSAVLERENQRNARHRAAMQQRRLVNYKEYHDRMLNSPEARDVDGGDALNVVLEKINSGLIPESFHKSTSIPLTVDEVRRIPFKLATVGTQSFSMHRLVLKERGEWPPAFQDPRFDGVRRDYETALELVLEQEVDGAMQIVAIDKLALAVRNLADDLERAFRDRPNDRRNLEASGTIRELERTVEMLKTHKLQRALGDLDLYSGTSVNDLREYMRNHHLQFAAATTADEKAVFRELYSKLWIHYEMVKEGVADDAEPR